MVKEEIPLSFYYWIHVRIHKKTLMGIISEDGIITILCRSFNIPKRVCSPIIKELCILGLIKRVDDKPHTKKKVDILFEVKTAEDEDEVIKKLENKLFNYL
jgi:hypothetical protein